MKTNTKKLVLTGLLVAIEIILSRFFSVQLPFFRISAAFIPLVLMGMLCGPAYAGAGGAMADFIGAVLFPAGAYFPGFTLTNALTGVAYGAGMEGRPQLAADHGDDPLRQPGAEPVPQHLLAVHHLGRGVSGTAAGPAGAVCHPGAHLYPGDRVYADAAGPHPSGSRLELIGFAVFCRFPCPYGAALGRPFSMAPGKEREKGPL